MLQFTLLIILFLPILVQSKGHWSYENINNWSQDNHYCDGISQSPIDLQFNISHYDRHLRQIHIEEERDPPEPILLVNNGHTAQLNLKGRYILQHIFPLSEDYRVEQIHFHWGHSNDNVNGSEHSLNGQSYPLEMHMVTYSSYFSNFNEAVSNIRALAVIGVFFELSNKSNPSLRPLVDALANISNKDDETSVGENFNIKALIGAKRLRRYYRYDGSLTTPPCFESVIWTVLQQPVKLSLDQLNAFRSLRDGKSKIMINTYRTKQELGKRRLIRSFYFENIHDEHKERSSMIGNHGRYLSSNINTPVVLTCLLMMFV